MNQWLVWRLRPVFLSALVSLVFSLCLQSASSAEIHDDALLTIRFATDATYPPLVSLDENREVTGFETEVLKLICQKKHFDCTFVHQEWDNLIPTLKSGKIDAIYGGIAITPARKEQFLFTTPLNDDSLAGMLSRQNKPFPFTQEGLANKRIAVQTGSTFAQYLTSTFKDVEVKRYVSIQDALLDLKAKRIDAVFGDTPVLRYFLHSLPPETQEQFLVSGVDLTPNNRSLLGEGYGVAFNRNKEAVAIIQQLNAGIAEIKKDEAYHALEVKFNLEP